MRMRYVMPALWCVLSGSVNAQAQEVVETTLRGVALDGVIGLGDGTSGRLWGVDPNAAFAPALWDTFGEQPLTCLLAGVLNTSPSGIYSNLPVFVCWTIMEEGGDLVYLHDWAVDQGLARPICIEADVFFTDECS